MKILDFIKDKAVFLGINIILFIIVIAIMIPLKVSLVIMFFIFCIWFLPLFTYILIDYIQYRKYFGSIESILEELDKKYLLPEVIEDSNILIGENINEILKELSKDMHENVKYYRNMQEDYREYIETWVHEIKTPIASTRLLIENNNNDVTRKIDIQLDKIENFVEQVLYYSRSDEVYKDYIIKEIPLGDVVRKVVKKNYRDFIGRKISLQLGEVDEIVYCDSKWIEFIINQILVNSIKYSKGKEDRISIFTEAQDNSVILNIEDNGVGIEERDKHRVFEKGFTGENGRRFGKSTGMGLYLCNKLCEKLGLGIALESKVNEGTRVKIIFPKGKI
ncbi:MAG: sensor histidine kinase [Clostridium sp.]